MMRVFGFLLLTVFAFNSHCQDFLVTNKMDTLFGDITFNSLDKVSIKNDVDKYTFKPYQILTFTTKAKVYKPIVHNNIRAIAMQIVEDDLSLYQIRSEGGYEFSTKILLRGDGATLEVTRLGFKKNATDFFSKCPTLASMIKDRTYKINDLDTIISEFNTSCPDESTAE